MDRHATINRIYRMVWSDARQAWIAVAECARGRGKRGRSRAGRLVVLVGGLGLAAGVAAQAPPAPTQLPTGGAVVGGAASISQGGARMDIQQSTARAAIDWQSFNVGAQAQVNFQQPSAASVTLNRVLDTQASQIHGRISANGQVFLSNPNGVYFGAGASVDVGGLVATTHRIALDDFLAGRDVFTRDGAIGSVVNDGTLQAALGGYIALLAPEVRNQGIVLAQAGTVAMAAGEMVSLQFDGSRHLTGVLVSASDIDTLVENGNAVRAPEGLIILSAQAANRLQGGVVRNSGALEATGLGSRGGKIVLDGSGLVDNGGRIDVSGTQGGGSIAITGDRMVSGGSLRADGGAGHIAVTLAHGLVETTGALASAEGGAGTIAVDGGEGRIYSSGRYTTDGLGAGQQGGRITITARDVALRGASASARGDAGGGTVLVGGGYQGADSAVRNAQVTTIGAGVTLNADAVRNGDGGKVVVWSDDRTVFAGAVSARGGAEGGDGGVLEVSGKQALHFGGTGDAHAPLGTSGTLLLDPKDIYIESTLSGQLELVDPHPTAGGSFGATTTVLTSGVSLTPTGYMVVTNPDDDLGAAAGGAAYLFRLSDQALVSTLYGTQANDKVGYNTSGNAAAVSLANGNFLVLSNQWNNGRGAVTFGNGTTGWGAGPVAVSASNSLVGVTGTHTSTQGYATSDGVGHTSYLKLLSNGNYLVGSPAWNDNRGALTFGDGTTGVSGMVSAVNSLVGSTPLTQLPNQSLTYKYGDQVGGSVTLLDNGNYVMVNGNWSQGVGAVTFGTATAALTGVLGASNSLVGDTTRADATGAGTGTDKIGRFFQALDGTQFLVYSSEWNAGSGAVTWFDGVNAVTGVVSAANSLVGNAGDGLSSLGITVLPGMNAYLVRSPNWNSGTGAVSWVAYGTDVKDVSIAANGVRGAANGDSIGTAGVTVLPNGDYVVSSPNFNGTRGAATLVDGTTGLTKVGQQGVVSSTNSLVGGQTNDRVGANGALSLGSNGNFLVLSPYWIYGSSGNAGAVTWSSGATPTVGQLTPVNSITGTGSNDRVGGYQYTYYDYGSTTPRSRDGASVTVLSNGNYVVSSPMWTSRRGAVTWVDGATGQTTDGSNTISAANSLVGSSNESFVGGFVAPVTVVTNTLNNTTSTYHAVSNGVLDLYNGNYVVASPYWANGAVARAGAVTWSNGSGSPTVGAVSASNSLVGSTAEDRVGSGRYNANGITRLLAGYDANGQQLYTGDYVVYSARWNNGAASDAGAVTWGDGQAPLAGAISDANSVLGDKTYTDSTGWTIVPLPVTGNYLIQNPWRDVGGASEAGAVTFVDGGTGRLSDYAAQGNRNILSSANSLVGSHDQDHVGDYYIDLLYEGLNPVSGTQRYTGNYVVLSPNWDNGALADAGAVTWGSGSTGVAGEINDGNSIVGAKAGDYLGQGASYATYTSLANGDYVVSSPTRDVDGVVNAGAVAWVDGNTGRLSDYAAQGNRNVLSAANALVGSHTDDFVGSSIYPSYYYTSDFNPGVLGYLVFSEVWNCVAGAVTYVDAAHSGGPFTGVVGPDNSAVGNPNNNFFGGLSTYPWVSLYGNDTAVVSFGGDNGHVVLASTVMPAAPDMSIPGATSFTDAAGLLQSMSPDYVAGVLRTGTSLTLQASNDIIVKSGIDATGGTAGGALTLQAGRSIAILGSIVTGNRDLNLIANDSLAHGVQDAHRDAGIATISMGSAPGGAAATIDAGSGNVSIRLETGSDKTHAMGGSISLNSITASRITVVNAGDGSGTVGDLPDLSKNCCGFDIGPRSPGADVLLNTGAVLSASASGTAVTLVADRNFVNGSGHGAGAITLADPSARWLVYADAPAGSSFGNLDSGQTAVWNAAYTGADATQAGNRYLFRYQPTITVGTQDVTKTYGEDLTVGTALVDGVVSLSGAQAGVAGAFLGDTVATALSGGITASSAGAAATAGVASGPYAITVNLAGATGNNGYAVALGSNTPRTLTVQAKVLTASLDGVSKEYDGSAAATLLSGHFMLQGLVGTDSFEVTQAAGLFDAADVSATSVSATLAAGHFTAVGATAAGNYVLPTSASGAASITPRALTVSVVNAGKDYDGTADATLAAANYSIGNLVGGQSITIGQAQGLFDSANVATATSVSAVLAAGDYTAGGGTSLANYLLPTSASGAASISPVALTAALTGSITKTYDGGTVAVLTGGHYQLGGFIGGQSATVTQAVGTYNSADVATASSVSATLGAGDFVAGNGTLLSNYVLPVSATGAASITPRTLTAAVSGNPTRAYDGGTAAAVPAAGLSLDGLVAGQSIDVAALTGSYDSRNAGTRTVTVALAAGDFTAGSGTLLGNYVLPTAATGTGRIDPLAVTLTAPAITKVYDGTLGYTAQAGDLAALSAALVGGDTVSAATLAYLDRNAGAGNKAVALNAVTLADGNGGGNYTVTLAGNTTSTITPRTLNVAATGVNRVYDTTTHATVLLDDDRVAGDALSLSATAAFADKNAGTAKSVNVAGIGLSGADALNYVLASSTASATADITPAPLLVTGVAVAGRAYDTTLLAALTGTPTVTPLGADVVVVGGTGVGSYADKNAGTAKAVTVSGYTISDPNYTLVQPQGLTGTVTPAVLGLGGFSIAAAKTYDGTTLAQLTGTPVVSGFNGEVVMVGGSGTGRFADKNVGTGKAVTVEGLVSSDPNYVIGQQAGLVGDIVPRMLTVDSVAALARSYDGGTAAQIDTASYVLGGVVAGESVGVGQSQGSYDSRNAGTRTVTVALAAGDFTAGSGTLLGNYVLPTAATGTGRIDPLAVTLTAPAITKVYDGTLGYTAQAGDLAALSAALVGGDTVSAATLAYLDRNAGAGNKAVALNAVTLADGNGGGNYTVTLSGNTTSTITPRTLNVAATGVNRVYDTTTHATVLLDDDRVAGDALSLSATAAFADKNAGTAKSVNVAGIGLSGADALNYVLASSTASATADITPAPLLVTGVAVAGRAYDTTLLAALTGTPTVTPLGADVVVLGGTGVGTYADKNAGTAKAVTVSGYTISDPNYELVQPQGLTGTVTPAVLGLGGFSVAAAKTYDGTTLAQLTGTPVVSGFNGEVVTVGGSGTGRFADKNVGTGKVVTVEGLVSSDPNYVIGQQAGLLGDIVPATIEVGGVRAVDRLYDGTTLVALAGTPVVSLFGADQVSVEGDASARTADPEAGTAKPVQVTGYRISGPDASNYMLLQPRGLTVDIVSAPDPADPGLVPPPPAVPVPVLPGPAQGAELGAPAFGVAAAGASTAMQAGLTPGITVALVQQPAGPQPGRIAVGVPRPTLEAGSGFAFPLPKSIIEAAVVRGVGVVVTSASGAALPSWLAYDMDSAAFVATNVPAGGLPIEVVITVGEQRFVLVVAESS